jgi:nicotinate-nucleotide adenylyltransferase
MARAAELARHPRIVVTGVEAALRTRYTADLIRHLKERAPDVHFVWIMGSDNLAQFHRWERWREIAASVPLAIVNRPGSLAAPLSSPAATALASSRVDEQNARAFAAKRAPAWIFLSGPRTALSSSSLRAGAKPS